MSSAESDKGFCRRISLWLEKPALRMLACFVCGLVYSLPYLCESLFILTYPALIAFFVLLYGTKKSFFGCCFCFTFGFYLLLYSFLSSLYPFSSFGLSPGAALIAIFAALVLIPLYHSALHSLVLLPLSRLSGLARTALMPVFWITAELVLRLGAFAFPWGSVALSQTGLLPAIQISSLFGDSAVALVVVGGCSFIAAGIYDKKKLIALAGCGVIALNLAVGTVMLLVPTPDVGEITVAAVQGNVSRDEKWNSEKLTEIEENYLELISRAAESGAKLIIVPESAIPQRFSDGGRLDTLLSEAAKRNDAAIVCGVLIYPETGMRNCVVAYSADGERCEEIYDKRHPVPFGEYIPYADFFTSLLPFLEDLNMADEALVAGENAVVLKTDAADVGTLVCFDSIFPLLARDEANFGAELMTVVTNDSWFLDSPGLSQHLRHAKLRAVENRRCTVQAANTGISAVITEKGVVLGATEPLERDITTGTVKLFNVKTLYGVIGDILALAAMSVSVIATAYVIYSAIRRKINGKQKNQAL